MKNVSTLLLSGLTAAILPNNAVAKATQKPNLVLVFVDDLGWGSFAPNLADFTTAELNQDFIKKFVKDYTPEESFEAAKAAMPTIINYTNEGVRFRNAYVTANVSAPSRAGMLTSSYQQRYGLYTNTEAESGVPLNIFMMPQLLKQEGYMNGIFGKWHNGNRTDEIYTCSPGHHPLDHGFDYFFGFNSHGTSYYNSPILFQNRKNVQCSEYTTDKFTNEAIQFIDNNKGKPKLVYLPYNAVHGPLGAPAPDKYLKRFNYGSKLLNNYSAYIAAIDDGIEAVMQKMESIGELDKTVLIFMSDNGAPGGAAATLPKNGPFSGFKGQNYQGGNHVPMFIWYGDKIKKGMVCDQLVSSMDIFPTFFDIAGINLPKNQKVDGKSLLPILQGKSTKEVHDYLVWMFQQAENWGMGNIKDQSVAKAAFMVRRGNAELRYFVESNSFFYNDLSKDRDEKINLIDSNSEEAEEMKTIFRNWFLEMKKPIAWKKELWQKIQFCDKSIPPVVQLQGDERGKKNKNKK
ncbi:MAG: sulfatase-like hydrolase/transferase [Paludibacter sp.]|nr:sulfatase-like hydrolase/transferase [Paludibacter sp.]